MKKLLLLAVTAVFLASCAGYFDMADRDSEKKGLKPLGLVGGGTLSDDDAQDQSPFLFRSGGRTYLFFSSDRGSPNQMNIWYAEMDPFTEKFFAPVRMSSAINTTANEESFVVFQWTNSFIYLTFLRRDSGNMVVTYVLDSSLNPVSNLQIFTNTNAAMIGLVQDSAEPELLIATASDTVVRYSFQTGVWVSNTVISNMGFPSASANGFRQDGNDYFIFSTTMFYQGHHQIWGGGTVVPGFYPVMFYTSPFNDFTPFVDPETYKVYFASDRYGKGNFDLYRYNWLTFDLFMITSNPETNIPMQIVYVSTSGSDGNSGLSPDYPLSNITHAIELAGSSNINMILVAAGVYTPLNGGLMENGSGVRIFEKTNIMITGGYDPTFSDVTGMSVLDGGNTLDRIVLIENSLGIYMENFVLRNNAPAAASDILGGGVLFTNSSTCMIDSSVISNCCASNGGGAAFYMSDACNLSFVTVSSNTATNGGGVFVYDRLVDLISLTNINNQAFGQGAAFYFQSVPMATIGACIVTNNIAFGINSVIHLFAGGDGSQLNISGNWIGGVGANSFAIYEEANVYDHRLVNNTFVSTGLAFLYRDYPGSEVIVTNDLNWTLINDVSYTGALAESTNNLLY